VIIEENKETASFIRIRKRFPIIYLAEYSYGMYSPFQVVASAEVLGGEGPGEVGQVEEDLLTKKS
jgi:hypothetical protein